MSGDLFNLPLDIHGQTQIEAGADLAFPIKFRTYTDDGTYVLALTPNEALALIRILRDRGDGIVVGIYTEQARKNEGSQEG